MQDDPAVERVREIRHQISQQCDHDPKKLVAYYMRLQERHKERLLEVVKDEKLTEAPAEA